MNRSRSTLPIGVCLAASFFAAVATAGVNPVSVSFNYPLGGEALTSGSQITLSWTASVTGPPGNDIGRLDVLASFDNGATWRPILVNGFGVSTLDWWVKNIPTTQLRFRVIATDFLANSAQATTPALSISYSGSGALVPTTDRDFELPGTQPIGFARAGSGELVGLTPIEDPVGCTACHAYYDPAVAPYEHWRGSMMAYSSIDPIFKAALEINDKVAPGSGETCLKCHIPTGWLQGRSSPSDGRAILTADMHGVSCELCHRLVDPVYEAGVSPIEDVQIITDIGGNLPSDFGNAMMVIDPNDTDIARRGPFPVPIAGHTVIVSPYHQESALCGTCHNVSNPAFDMVNGVGTPNTFNQPTSTPNSGHMMSEQRTYSEWFFSAYNTPQGVFAPQFGGNRQYVASCQDCHMRDVTGKGCGFGASPVRQDQPLHDMSGSAVWMLSVLDQVDPTVVEPIFEVNPGEFVEFGSLWIQDGINRARYMLQNAAEMDVDTVPQGQLKVRITNNTGHKLPTGYPEGRRMWLNVKYFDASNQLISESAAYNPANAVLTLDSEAKVYEGKPVIDENLAPLVGLPANTPNFLALNNRWLKDNRIPPLGFSNAAYASVGAAPVGATYADGQNWDDTFYNIPDGATRAEVRLFHQTLSKEYMEFLRDESSPGGPGEFAYNLWNNNDKATPEQMEFVTLNLPSTLVGDCNCDGFVTVGDIAAFVLALTDAPGYATQYPDCLISNADTNSDGFVTVGDIAAFVALLTGG